MPAYLRDAVVAIEDRRFYYHHGVDGRAIIRAAYVNAAEGTVVEGGSTITQQLVKILYVGNADTLRRKIDEAALAWQLEDRMHEGPDPHEATSTPCTSARAPTACRRRRRPTSRSTPSRADR